MSIEQDLDLVVFDMAGTTVQDNGEVPAAFASALAGYGIDVTPAQIRAVRGRSKRQALFQLLPPSPDREETADRLYESFKEHLAHRYTSGGVRAIAGAEQAFQELREWGVRIALNTGFDRDTATLLLEALRWNDGRVDAVVCGDEVLQGRPAPYLIFHAMEASGAISPRRVAVVGDTTRDLQAGDNAGVRWNIGVLSGAHDKAMLEAVPHTLLLPSVAELAQALRLSAR
ncbi:MAG: phosphonatase-like hydrolase [Acidobacteria bacterium]|nr:phosphonatase-like hydrolase [Acidobacteriota bacterium]MDA1236554.1 phosphonatase-like hydrolase [Acidobacteriota bacterium]